MKTEYQSILLTRPWPLGLSDGGFETAVCWLLRPLVFYTCCYSLHPWGFLTHKPNFKVGGPPYCLPYKPIGLRKGSKHTALVGSCAKQAALTERG